MRSHGWSLTELLIGLAVFSVIMTGVYQYSLQSSRVSHETLSGNLFDRNAQKVKRVLEQKLKNLGYNPELTPYDIEEPCGPSDSPFSDHRIGLAAAEPFRLLYTSDDNILFKPDVTNSEGLNGLIQNAEKYGFWAAASETEPAISWSGLVDPNGELCDPLSDGSFNEPYKLYHRVKNAEATNVLADWTIPAVLADNVVCFEVRYYAQGIESGDPTWKRVWSDAVNADFEDHAEVYKIPSTIGCGDSVALPQYMKYIRDSIRLVRVGVVLVAAPSKTETLSLGNKFTGDDRRVKRIVVETRLANNPWLPESLVANDGSSICMPSRPCP